MIRCCLIGRGIAASPSPALHHALMRACGVDGAYQLCDVSEAELPALLGRVRAGAYRGCNVTIPYKLTVAEACDALEGDAVLLGAVNTLTLEQGSLVGGNTDAAGFERALEVHGMTPAPGAESLVLGAGGAAAAVCLALTRLQASSITIVARREEAAVAIARLLPAGAEARAVGWSRATVGPLLGSLDLVVNATSVGISLLPFHPRDLPVSCTVADVRYAPAPVDVVTAARASGHRACDGMEMLLQQAMLSFERWTGLEPSAPVGRRALHEHLG